MMMTLSRVGGIPFVESLEFGTGTMKTIVGFLLIVGCRCWPKCG